MLERDQSFLEEINKLENQNLSIEIDGEEYTICIINWDKIVAEHDRVLEENSDKTNEEMDKFWAHTSTKMMSIYDYFLYDEIMEMKVDNEELLPIGLLGLDASAHTHGYGELNNDGFIAIDLTKSNIMEAPVYFIEEYDQLEIASSFKEFVEQLQLN